MKEVESIQDPDVDGMRPEYRFDYTNARPNRFAASVDVEEPGGVRSLVKVRPNRFALGGTAVVPAT